MGAKWPLPTSRPEESWFQVKRQLRLILLRSLRCFPADLFYRRCWFSLECITSSHNTRQRQSFLLLWSDSWMTVGLRAAAGLCQITNRLGTTVQFHLQTSEHVKCCVFKLFKVFCVHPLYSQIRLLMYSSWRNWDVLAELLWNPWNPILSFDIKAC